MKKFEFQEGSRKSVVQAMRLGSQVWVHLDGKTFVVEVDQKSQRRGRKSDQDLARNLKAPMPGKVTKILVPQGQQVQKGDAILVMEAMKMEYTLKAEGPGLVKKLCCEVGQQVVLGALLAEIEPEEKPVAPSGDQK